MEDWELVRGRLQQMVEDDPRWADIRAALERVEDQAKALDDTLTEYENAMRELGTLRQRVEELERERDEWRDLAKAEGADEEHERQLVKRAEAAEADRDEWRDTARSEMAGRAALQAEVARLALIIQRLAPERDHLRRLRDHLLKASEVNGTEIRSLKAEVARLRKEVPTAAQEVWRAEANRQSARAEAAEAALREWREAESLPDCVACCTLDAALCPEVKP